MGELVQLEQCKLLISRSDTFRWPILQWFIRNKFERIPQWLEHLFFVGSRVGSSSIEEDFRQFILWSNVFSRSDVRNYDELWSNCIQLFNLCGLSWESNFQFYAVVSTAPWSVLHAILNSSMVSQIRWDQQKYCLPKLFSFSCKQAQAAWSNMIQYFDRETVEFAFWSMWSSMLDNSDKIVWSEIWIKRCIETYGDAADLLANSPQGWTIVGYYNHHLCQQQDYRKKREQFFTKMSHIQQLRRQRKTKMQEALLCVFLFQPIPEVYRLVSEYATVHTMSYDTWSHKAANQISETTFKIEPLPWKYFD